MLNLVVFVRLTVEANKDKLKVISIEFSQFIHKLQFGKVILVFCTLNTEKLMNYKVAHFYPT